VQECPKRTAKCRPAPIARAGREIEGSSYDAYASRALGAEAFHAFVSPFAVAKRQPRGRRSGLPFAARGEVPNELHIRKRVAGPQGRTGADFTLPPSLLAPDRANPSTDRNFFRHSTSGFS
jgi:hypothetical protein